jgi:hypothetical protein
VPVPEALFDAGPAAKWMGGRALVPLPADACPACGGAVTTVSVSEAPLFRHGGYGAVRRSTSRVCAMALAGHGCRWGLTVDVTEVNPRGMVSSV